MKIRTESILSAALKTSTMRREMNSLVAQARSPLTAGFSPVIGIDHVGAVHQRVLETDPGSASNSIKGRNQAVDAPRLNSSLSISRGVAPPRICRGVSLSSFCTHATCSGVTVAKSVPFL